MRPGTVHSVTTLQDSITLGGHFFCAPTIKHSAHSIFHTFVGSNTITNVPMDNEQEMLLRIVLFWFKVMCQRGSSYVDSLGKGSKSLYWICLMSVSISPFPRFHSPHSKPAWFRRLLELCLSPKLCRTGSHCDSLPVQFALLGQFRTKYLWITLSAQSRNAPLVTKTLSACFRTTR